MIVGHEAVRGELESSLPAVTLIIGPPSIGKATLARHLLQFSGPCWSTDYGNLTAGLARQIVEGAPVRHKPTDIRIVDLDGSTEAAQNILLKVLEEPPPHCRFILLASSAPLVTIVSRSRTFQLGLLTDEQVAAVLMENCGVRSEHEARMAAARARGQVARALAVVGDSESQRVSSVVATAVRAASSSDLNSLDLALRNWTPEHTVVLRRWAAEAVTGRWVLFSEDFAPGIPRARITRVLQALSDYPDARTGPAVALTALKDPRKL
jgi:DNA polymerase III delta prime subunit